MAEEKLADKPHILIIDDDKRICSLINRYLRDHDFVTATAHNAKEARDILKIAAFDAAVVDIMMPGETGLSLTEFIEKEIGMPVLLLTALGDTEDRLRGFDAGADDYLPKPFEPMELVMRLKAILRRSARQSPKAIESNSFTIGPWHTDFDRKALVQGEDFLKLTDIENRLIKALCSYAGEPVSRERLADICEIEAGERTIDVQVTRLRKKLEADTKNPRYLQTVRGKGYVLHAERSA